MLNNLFNQKIFFPNDLSRMLLKGNVKEIIIRFEHNIDPKYTKENLTRFHEYQRKYYKDLYFDSLGNIREEIQFKYIDEIDSHKFFCYNVRNELIYGIYKIRNILHSYEYQFSYLPTSIRISQKINNEKDNSFSMTVQLKNKSLVKEITEEKSSTGKYVSFQRYEDDKLVEINKPQFKKLFYYDNARNIIRIEYCDNGILGNECYLRKNYEYDIQDRLLSCRVYRKNPGEDETLENNYTYENDFQGNWIYKKITNTKDKSIINVFRTIKYYSL